MSVVEQFLLKTEEIDPDFRLWITSEPNTRFPIGLLQVDPIATYRPWPYGLQPCMGVWPSAMAV